MITKGRQETKAHDPSRQLYFLPLCPCVHRGVRGWAFAVSLTAVGGRLNVGNMTTRRLALVSVIGLSLSGFVRPRLPGTLLAAARTA